MLYFQSTHGMIEMIKSGREIKDTNILDLSLEKAMNQKDELWKGICTHRGLFHKWDL